MPKPIDIAENYLEMLNYGGNSTELLVYLADAYKDLVEYIEQLELDLTIRKAYMKPETVCTKILHYMKGAESE